MKKILALVVLALALIFASFSFSQTKTLIKNSTNALSGAQLTHSSVAKLEFNVTIPAYQKLSKVIDSQSFDLLKIDGFSGKSDVGQPDVPLIGKMILLPNDSPVSITIQGDKYVELENVFIAPVSPPSPENKNPMRDWIDNAVYEKSAFYPEKIAWTEPAKIVRGYRVTTLWISPIRFNPVEKRVRIYYDFRVTVSFGNSQPMNYPKRLKSPAFSNLLKRAVVNWQISQSFSLPEAASDSQYDFFTGCDYLIISHSRFLTAANQLAQWKRMCGFSAKVVDVAKIGADAASIRNFIQNAYEHWNPAPAYVVFFGDAEFVPTNYYTKHSSDDNGTIGTDLYYTTVDGSDYFPDIISGRIPVDEPIEAYSFVQKVIQYEKNPIADPSFYQNIVVASYFQDDDDTDTPNYNERDGYEDRRFVLTSEEIRVFLLSKGYQAQRVYYAKSAVDPQFYNNGSYANGERLPQELLRSKGFAWDGDAGDISNAIERGCFLVSHRDHGSRNGWGDPSYKIGDVKALSNGDKLPIVMSINCATGWYDNETDDEVTGTSPSAECFVESWIRNLHGGAVGVFGATRVSYSGYNDILAKGILDAIWPDFLPNDSPENSNASLGGALNYGKLIMASQYSANKTRLVEFEEFHYYGDPAMKIWTQLPKTLEVAHANSLNLNQTGFAVSSSAAGATVALVQGDQLLAVGETDSAGEANLYFSPISSDTPVSLVVRKENYRPYAAELSVSGAQNGTVVLSSVEMEDENDNSEINVGENIRWHFIFENNGQTTAENINLMLLSEDSLISIQAKSCTIQAIAAGEAVGVDSLNFFVAAECPDQHLVEMNLQIINSPDTLIYPLDLKVKAGEPELSVSPILLAENLQPGDSLTMELAVQNSGFGPGNFTVKDVSRLQIAIGDTTKKLWLGTNSGCGNVFYASKSENLLRFSFFMDVDSTTDISYFIYEGSHLTGNFILKWSESDKLTEQGIGFQSTGLINFPMESGKYYYLGASWADKDSKICRAEEYPPVNYSFGDLLTGTVNVGSMSPEDTVKQNYSRIFTFVQQLSFGSSPWIEVPLTAKTLVPGENINFPVEIKAPFADTLLQTDLIVAAESGGKDSVIIPVAIATTNEGGIALNFAGPKEDANQDGKINPGETVILSVVVKNLGDQPLADVNLTVTSEDSLIEFFEESAIIPLINGYEQKTIDGFSMSVSNYAEPGHVMNLLITAEYDSGKTKQLPFSFSVEEGIPEIITTPDTVFVTADTFLQIIDKNVTITNSGYAAFPFQIVNPVLHEIPIGNISDQAGLALSNGCGNVYFFLKNEKLQKAEMTFDVTSGGRVYFFVYECESNIGEFRRIYYGSADVTKAGNVTVESARMNLSLEKNHFYYVGACWQGEMKIRRLQQVAPVSFQTFQVSGGCFAPTSVPPHETVTVNTATPMLLAQKIMLGQGTWLQTGKATDILYPGESVDIPVSLFANESDTVLTAKLFIKSLNSDFSNILVPVNFHVNATATSVVEVANNRIKNFALRQNYPNPFNPNTMISFELPRSSFVEIRVYNTLGQQIKKLTARKYTSGVHRIEWDGTNANGIPVASGIYLVRFKSENVTLSRKVILLR